jgi:hypothetical protein
MGCQPYQGAGYLDVTNPEIHKMYEEFYHAKLPLHVGYKIPQMYDAALNVSGYAVEGFADADATQLRLSELLAACPKLTLLVTSSAPLHHLP